jgi:HicB family
MSRLTLRLPESLHRKLADQAEREGVSLNHYIVFSLTRAVSVADLTAQREAFDRLKDRYPSDEADEALREVLATRI